LFQPLVEITREYQYDSPSKTASLLKSGLSRDGPGVRKKQIEKPGKRAMGLTGSFISVARFIGRIEALYTSIPAKSAQ
jgi:hypothetical protein